MIYSRKPVYFESGLGLHFRVPVPSCTYLDIIIVPIAGHLLNIFPHETAGFVYVDTVSYLHILDAIYL